MEKCSLRDTLSRVRTCQMFELFCSTFQFSDIALNRRLFVPSCRVPGAVVVILIHQGDQVLQLLAEITWNRL